MNLKKILLSTISLISIVLVDAETIDIECELPTSDAKILSIDKRPVNELYNPTKSANITFSPLGFTAEEEAAFRYAMEIWAQALPATAKINVTADFGCTSSTLAYKASVTVVTDDSTQISYPSALYRYIYDLPKTDEADITIHFNSNRSIWHFSTDPAVTIPEGKYDFVTHTLRAIGLGLGFGSSLMGTTIGSASIYSDPYIFDSFVINEAGITLSSLENRSTEFRNYIRNNTYFSINNPFDYQLYSPSTYKNYVTLKYFAPEETANPEKALMYPVVDGKCHVIGEKVIDILEVMGWKEKVLTINTSDIDTTGIVQLDPNQELGFYTTGLQVNDVEWTFEIYQDDMSTRLIYSDTGEKFAIYLPEEYEENDYRSAEGFVKCLITATGTTDAGEVKTASYSMFIEFRPPVPKMWLKDSQLINGRYQLTFGINAYGANRYYVTEYNGAVSAMTDYDVRQSGYAIWINPYILKGYYYSFTIWAYNDYGQSDGICYDLGDIDITKPITDPILLPIANPIETGVEFIESQQERATIVNYYNISGQKISEGSDDLDNKHLPKGVYIKESIYNSGEKFHNKIIIRE